MSISPLSADSSLLSTLLNGQQGAGASAASDLSQLLSGPDTSRTAGTTNSLLQELVSLGTGNAADSQTYNAQGLLQQLETNQALNDPLLADAGTSSGNSAPSLMDLIGGVGSPSLSLDSVLGSLLSSSGSSASSTGGGSASTAGETASGASAAAATDPTSQLVQAIKQNPALASELIANATAQNLLSSL